MAGIFVTDSLPDEARAILGGFEVYEEDPGDEVLARCDVLVSWPSRVDAALVSRMPRLQAVQVLSAGVDSLAFGALPESVKVFSNAGAYTGSVAEHAFGLMLGVAKGVHVRDRKVSPRVLRGKTAVMLGCGSIGSEVARLCRLLDMRTVGVSRSFRIPDHFDEKLPVSSLAEAVTVADALVIALPLTRETRGMVGASVLAACKPDVTIVNVGRGETVVEADLLEWLRARPESRYATDVFWKKDGRETFDTPAWGLPNFGGTRHDSGVPRGDTLTVPKVEAAKNVRRFLQTGEGANQVDRAEYL